MRNKEEIKKRYKLKTDAAIDAIESGISYDEFAGFMDIFIDLLYHEHINSLCKQEIDNIGQLVKIMCGFVESEDLNKVLVSYHLGTYPFSETDTSAYRMNHRENKIDTFKDKVLDWLNELPDYRYRNNIFLLARELTTPDFLFEELINWIDDMATKEYLTLSTLIISYYSWFPYITYLKL